MSNKLIIMQDLKNHLLNNYGKDLVNIYLFGSQADGAQTTESDYDVLILLKTKKDWKAKGNNLDLCYDIDLKHDIIIEPHILAEEELLTLRGKQPIFVNAMQKGIKL